MVSEVRLGETALHQLIAIARAAGAAVMAHYGREGHVQLKADTSPVTVADHAAHHVIVNALTANWPQIPVISEEGEIPPFETRAHWRRFWLVDPLDGTKEFIHQNGEFTVNIALIEDGIPVLGVVFAPALDVLYAAGLELGSWKYAGDTPPVRLHGPQAPDATGVTIVESRSHPSAALEAYLATLTVAARVPAGSSLKFGLVAEGRAHLYPRLGPTMEWDVAAGDCIYRYAIADGVRPSPLAYNSPSLKNPSFVLGVTS
ncbi:MAG: 3'(2'),5'-bisphosphate nucleotidase CysQ [Gemmatimonas sp.]